MSKELTLLKALENIKDIELTHMTYDSDENYDGEWEYEAVEVDDGTIEDNFPKEIKILEDAVKSLEIIKSKEMLSVFKDISDKCFIVFNTTAVEISQEEYDLLKEVLEND